MNFRSRLENSDLLAAILSGILATYLRFCFATTRWQIKGLQQLVTELERGPILFIVWHQHLLLGPLSWPKDRASIHTLRDPSPAGRLSSETQTRLGMKPIVMQANSSNFAASRKILQVVRNGNCLGMTADGPLGPARQCKQAPLEWARATGRPVFLFAWSARRYKTLGTWDRMMLPVPFTKGVYEFRRWQVAIPRKIDQQGYADLRAAMAKDLDALAAEQNIS